MPNTLATTRLCGAAAVLFASCLLLPSLARAQEFPDGQGKDVLEKVCTACHNLEQIPHLKYSKKEWEDVVVTMKDNGAEATDDEFDVIVEYLSKNFGEAPEKININKATAPEIEKGLGLATKEAAAIVQYRTKNGNFKTIDDLKKVEGVDAKKLDAAKDRVAF